MAKSFPHDVIHAGHHNDIFRTKTAANNAAFEAFRAGLA